MKWYYNCYGVHGNSKSLKADYYQATRIVFKWLNRRSQRRSKNWRGFKELLKHFEVPQPRMRERLFNRPAACSV
jgi:hypothetical protein